jgi:hypothetical protein
MNIKTILRLFFCSFLLFSSSVYASTTPPVETKIIPGGDIYKKIASLKLKDIQRITGKKLTLKEKIALKVFQWKYKNGLKAKKAEGTGNKGKTAMILGIVGIAALLVPYFAIVSIPCAILAIVFGSKAKKTDPDNGQAKAGVILGIVTLGLIALALVIVIAVLASGGFWFG